MFNETEMDLCLKIAQTLRNFADKPESLYKGQSTYDGLIFLFNVFSTIENLTICMSSKGYPIDEVSYIFLELLENLTYSRSLDQFYNTTQDYLSKISNLSHECNELLSQLLQQKIVQSPPPKSKGGFWQFCKKLEAGIAQGLYILDGKIPDKLKLIYPVLDNMAEWLCELSEAGLLQTVQLLQLWYFPSISVSCLFTIVHFFISYRKGGYKAFVKSGVVEINKDISSRIKERSIRAKEMSKEMSKEMAKEMRSVKEIPEPKQTRIIMKEKTELAESSSELKKIATQVGIELYSDKKVPVELRSMDPYDRPTVEEYALMKMYESKDPTVQDVLSQDLGISDLISQENEDFVIREADREYIEIRKQTNPLITKYIQNHEEIRELNKNITEAKRKMRVIYWGITLTSFLHPDAAELKRVIDRDVKRRDELIESTKEEFDEVTKLLRIPNLENLKKMITIQEEQDRILQKLPLEEQRAVSDMLNLERMLDQVKEAKENDPKSSETIKKIFKNSKILTPGMTSAVLGIEPIVDLQEEKTRALVLTSIAFISPIRFTNLYHNWKIFQRPVTNIFRKNAIKLKTASELKSGGYKPMNIYYSFWHSLASLGFVSVLYSNYIQDSLRHFDTENVAPTADELGGPCNVSSENMEMETFEGMEPEPFSQTPVELSRFTSTQQTPLQQTKVVSTQPFSQTPVQMATPTPLTQTVPTQRTTQRLQPTTFNTVQFPSTPTPIPTQRTTQRLQPTTFNTVQFPPSTQPSSPIKQNYFQPTRPYQPNAQEPPQPPQ